MTEQEAFLHAILDAADDDTPRLVYADWLEEHGQAERAEFIRLQIERNRLPPNDDRHPELLAREKQLERQHGSTWLGSSPPGVGVTGFVRGFPECIGLPLRNWPEWNLSPTVLHDMEPVLDRFPIRTFQAYQLLGCAPAHYPPSARQVYPTRGQTGLELLATWPSLRRLSAIHIGFSGFCEGAGDSTWGVDALASSPHAAGLKTLHLSGVNFEPETFRVLAASPHLSLLTNLDISYNTNLTDEDLWELASAPLGLRLQRLTCTGCAFSAQFLRVVLDGASLRRLEIGADALGEPGVGPLLGSARLGGLRSLALRYEGEAAHEDRSPERDEVCVVPYLTEFLASPALAELDELTLCGLDLGDEGVRTLAVSPLAGRVVRLTLDRCRLTGACLPALRKLLVEGRLRRLGLDNNFLHDTDVATLAAWPELRRLHELELEFNDIDEPGFDALSDSPYRHPFLYLSG